SVCRSTPAAPSGACPQLGLPGLRAASTPAASLDRLPFVMPQSPLVAADRPFAETQPGQHGPHQTLLPSQAQQPKTTEALQPVTPCLPPLPRQWLNTCPAAPVVLLSFR